MSNECDVAVIIALEEEFQALVDVLKEAGARQRPSPPRLETTTFYEFEFDKSRHKRWILSYVQDERDVTGTSIATERLLTKWSPGLLLSFGISGSVHTDAALGDVVIATSVRDYIHRSKIADGASTALDDIDLGGREISTFVQYPRAAEQLMSEHTHAYVEWQQAAARGLLAAGHGVTDALRHNDTAGARVVPRVMTGPVATAPWVVSNADLKTWIRKRLNRNMLAVDTESFGVLRTASDRTNPIPTLVVRGISDAAHGKSALDAVGGGAVRRWSLRNAARALLLLLETLSVKTGGAPEESVRASVHAQVVSKWLRGQVPNPLTNAEVELYGLVSEVDGERESNDIIDHLASGIERSDGTLLQVRGPAGVGKTRFARGLYERMRIRAVTDPSAPIPILIDTARYDSEASDASPTAPPPSWEKEIADTLASVDGNKDQAFAFIVDSVDPHHPFSGHILQELGQISQTRGRRVKRVLLTRGDDQAIYETVQTVLTMDAVSADHVRFERVVEVYLITLKLEASRGKKLIERARHYQLPQWDLRALKILATKGNAPAYNRARTVSDFLDRYCEDLRVNRADLASTAFRRFIENDSAALPQEPKHKAFLFQHPIMRDFLIALHVVHLIERYAQEYPNAPSRSLDYVYPSRVMRRVKEVVNGTEPAQSHVIQALNQALDDGGTARTLAVLSYLAGRLRDRQHLRAAGPLLKRVVGLFRDRAEEDNDALLALRSAYVGLMSFGDAEAGKTYVTKLLHNKHWDDLNRGFHLEYYGDIPFNPGIKMCHTDKLEDCSRTFEHLLSRVRANLTGKTPPLFQLEVHTLCSLARHRHEQRNGLNESHRSQVCDVASRLHDRADLMPELRAYLWAVKTDLAIRDFHVGMLAEVVFRLKDYARTGWQQRDILPCESVADHVFGTYMLGLLFLPRSAKPDYDKQRVLNMVMIHDLAEAITGDVPSTDKVMSNKEEEHRWMAYFAAASSYETVDDGVADILPLYDEYVQAASTNGKVARELDKIDNLLQLHIYRQRHWDIKDYDGWRSELERFVTTEQGLTVLSAVQGYMNSAPHDLGALASRFRLPSGLPDSTSKRSSQTNVRVPSSTRTPARSGRGSKKAP